MLLWHYVSYTPSLYEIETIELLVTLTLEFIFEKFINKIVIVEIVSNFKSWLNKLNISRTFKLKSLFPDIRFKLITTFGMLISRIGKIIVVNFSCVRISAYFAIVARCNIFIRSYPNLTNIFNMFFLSLLQIFFFIISNYMFLTYVHRKFENCWFFYRNVGIGIILYNCT